MMGQRAYCDRDHPGGDVEADRWCEMYHRPQLPLDRAEPDRDLPPIDEDDDGPFSVDGLPAILREDVDELDYDRWEGMA